MTMLTDVMLPSAAALTASRPINAPVGTKMRAPVVRARSIRSPSSSSAPTESGTKIRACAIAGSATARNSARGNDSTITSQLAASDLKSRAATAAPSRLATDDGSEPQPRSTRVQGSLPPTARARRRCRRPRGPRFPRAGGSCLDPFAAASNRSTLLLKRASWSRIATNASSGLPAKIARTIESCSSCETASRST